MSLMALLLIRFGRPYSPKHIFFGRGPGVGVGGGGWDFMLSLEIVPIFLARIVGLSILTQTILSRITGKIENLHPCKKHVKTMQIIENIL